MGWFAIYWSLNHALHCYLMFDPNEMNLLIIKM